MLLPDIMLIFQSLHPVCSQNGVNLVQQLLAYQFPLIHGSCVILLSWSSGPIIGSSNPRTKNFLEAPLQVVQLVFNRVLR